MGKITKLKINPGTEDGTFVFPKFKSDETDRIIRKLNKIIDIINSKYGLNCKNLT